MNDEPDTYEVTVNVQIRRVGPHGYRYADNMEFRSTADIGALNFRGIADLLLRFQELTENAIETIQFTKENQNG